jgi:hypothetical protein
MSHQSDIFSDRLQGDNITVRSQREKELLAVFYQLRL